MRKRNKIEKKVTGIKTISISLSLFIILIVLSFISLSIGQGKFDPFFLYHNFLSKEEGEVFHRIIFDIRLPRILLAILVGGGLSISGVIFQAILRNPLADPYILGISSGASVGTLISLMFGFNLWFITTPVFAFIGALIVVFVVYFLGRKYGALDTNLMLLSGVMIGSFLNAIVLFLISFIGQPVRNALVWLLGNISNTDLRSIIIVAPIVLISSILLYYYSVKLNLITTGDELATQLGVDTNKVKKIIYILASLIVGSLVSVSGAIGFVGLVIPHSCRLFFGSDHRILIPTSFLVGSIFFVGIDIISRVVMYPIEIPIGALTSLIGAPIFIYLLRRKK